MDRIGLICRAIKEHPDCTQRTLASLLDLSLGTINADVKECISLGYLITSPDLHGYTLTQAGQDYLDQFKVDGAIMLAAGLGSRFVPMTFDTPKGLLEVFGERMVERQICQLKEAGIDDITIVVGYLKEKFEYLTDKYGVKLLYNPEYAKKNTVATLYHAKELLRGRNMYVLASDNWIRSNMYHAWECDPWYASTYMKGETSEWVLTYNKGGRITDITIGGSDAWVMYGPAFISKEYSETLNHLLDEAYHTPGMEDYYWENVLKDNIDRLRIFINRQPDDQIYEFENMDELRSFDPKYQDNPDNEALSLISRIFDVPVSSIYDIDCLKAGMTNDSFLFRIGDRHYVCRIPGKGTSFLINRQHEAEVYEAVKPLDLTEEIIYLDPVTGYKIAVYYDDSRTADSANPADMARCMDALHILHDSGVTVGHSFDMRERINFYEGLCITHGGTLFEDYAKVRGWMDELMDRLDALDRPQVLCHIDSIADNFLFLPDGETKIIDWEYAGMSDPLMDVAMCAIFSYYNNEDSEKLLSTYLRREPTPEEKFVFYACMALGGFLWSLWAVYKAALGSEYGDYTLIMYRYAKEYYRKIEQEAL